MEIKKGISQMAEYPNVEINYVVPKNGNMYYVLKEGILENGVIIATLDPRHAIDEVNPCNSVGVFSERGDVIVDFDKKSIKKITDELLLVVNSRPITNEVIENISKQNDEISKSAVEDNKRAIVDKLMNEMGPNGEFIFSDPYGEANVYITDSYNNKIGLDCSYIGKNEKGLYFHTGDINSISKFVKVDEFNINGNDELVSEELNGVNDVVVPASDSVEVASMDNASVNVVEDVDSLENEEFKLDISKDILEGFKISDDELNQITPEEIASEMNEVSDVKPDEVEEKIEEDDSNVVDNVEEEVIKKEESVDSDNDNEDEIFDNAIDVIDKLIKETNKLNDRIKDLEEEIKEKTRIIEEHEEKKDELNDYLNKANKVLDNIK